MNLEVFGLDDHHVAGGSVFPVPGTANPTDPVVALTLRLADHLIARIRGPRSLDALRRVRGA